MRIDENNAQHLGRFKITLQIQQHKTKEYKNTTYFNSGAPRHAIHSIVKEIDQIAAHGQYNKGIEVPESGTRSGRGAVVYRLLNGLIQRTKYWKSFKYM